MRQEKDSPYVKRNRLELEVSDQTEEYRHFHQEIELLYVLEGEMFLTVGRQELHLKKEDLYVVNANNIHSFQATDDILYVKLSITYQMVADVYVQAPLLFLCNSAADSSEKYNRLRGGMNRLLNYYLLSKGKKASFRYIALGYDVLDILTEEFLVKTPDAKHTEKYHRLDTRIDLINNYIRANYGQSISLKELSEKLFLSQGYLSRFFKRNYGMSFTDYLSNVRLHHAMEDLMYTDLPITKIVYANGFSNQTVFSKMFKSIYGDTPSAFRSRARQEKEQGDGGELAWFRDERLAGFLSQHMEEDSPSVLFEEPVQSYSVKEYEGSRRSLFRTVNVGMAEDLLRSELQEHIIHLKKTIGMEYVRFCNLFTPELLIRTEEEDAQLNLSKIYRIFDFLQEQKLKAHIEIGMKPRRLMRNLVNYVDEDQSTQNRGKLSPVKWQILMNALLSRLSRRYGEALDTWRIELWFDEEQWEGQGTMAEYFELFRIVYETVRRYSSRMEVGGCGLKFDYLENQIARFLAGWGRQQVQPDFISVLFYAYERGTAIEDISFRRSTDTGYLKKCIGKLKTLIEKTALKDCKLYLTEWNLTVSDRNFINDTCYKGTYIVKNLLDIYGEVDDTAYFLASDCVTENYDSAGLLYGGTGLISRDGIMKPAGHAYHFLHRMYPYRIAMTEHYLVTTNGRDSYTMICHNQMELASSYYFTREDAVKKEHLDSYFSESHRLKLRIDLKDVPCGGYRVKTYRVNRHNGSVLDVWKELDYGTDLSQEDILYLRGASGPKLTIREVMNEEGYIPFNLTLDANEIVFLEITAV